MEPASLVELTKPAPTDVLSPAWPHLLRFPKTVPPTGDKISEYLKPVGAILIQTTTVTLSVEGDAKLLGRLGK